MNDELQFALLAPISPASPAGEDLSYSRIFDEIREARRADDPLLSQGDWETGIKVADWPKVLQLCEQALQRDTKDLQLAVWYIEALTRQNDFAGLRFGLQILLGLIEQFWEALYPAFDPHDLDERIGKFEWLNKQLAVVVREVPLTCPQQGGYSWYAWQESREVKNLGLKDGSQREAAIGGGKLSDERFDKSARDSGQRYYVDLATALGSVRRDLGLLEACLDARMGAQSPNLGDLRRALVECEEVTKQISAQWGETLAPHDAEMSAQPASTERLPASVVVPGVVTSVSIGTLTSRSDALHALRQVAQYFRTNEPHSPVALLAERAARWGEMPLEAWLASVIKDSSTLHQLNDLLDVRSQD